MSGEGEERLPPWSLTYMRLIGNGYPVPAEHQGPVWRAMVRLFEEDPRRFVSDWHKAEMDWERLLDSGRGAVQTGPCAECERRKALEGSERNVPLEELLGRVIRGEAGGEAS